MRLDRQLRDFITATWADADARRAVAALLQGQPEALRSSIVMASRIGAPTAISIAPSVLVVTRDAIGYGWPMTEVIWEYERRDAPDR